MLAGFQPMTLSFAVLSLTLAGVGAGMTSVGVQARPGDGIFAQTNARTLRIDIAASDIESLKTESRRYVRATVSDGASVYHNVGVRLKGKSTFRPLGLKPNFALNFHEFVPAQRYDGLSKFLLHNAVQDGSYLHEFLATSLFRDAHVPAARVTYARVELNGRDLGLYVLVEAMNKDFLRRHFNSAEGNLYEGVARDIDKTLEQDNGNDDSQFDRRRLLAAAQTKDLAERLRQLQQCLDVNRFLSFTALEMFLGHSDGYVMSRNNYRLYFDPASEQMIFIPHGLDGAFINGLGLRPPNNTILIRALFQDPDTQRQYRQRCAELITNVWRLSTLTNRINEGVARMLSVATSQQESNLWRKLGRGMHERVSTRFAELVRGLDEPEPQPIPFDAAGVALLSGWNPNIEGGAPSLHKVREAEKRLLYMQAFQEGSICSWRTRVLLPEGTFHFVGKARCKRVTGGFGAGLRTRDTRRMTALREDADWQELVCPIEVAGGSAEVELICELWATEGEAWFDLDSLRLERVRTPDVPADASR